MANIEHIRLWVDALRSGKYKQGSGYLRQGDKYCCLGVVCELCPLVEAEASNALSNEDPEYERTVYYYDGQMGLLPGAVADWLGLESDPILKNRVGDEPLTATNANDTESMSFETIARLIEEKYLK